MSTQLRSRQPGPGASGGIDAGGGDGAGRAVARPADLKVAARRPAGQDPPAGPDIVVGNRPPVHTVPHEDAGPPTLSREFWSLLAMAAPSGTSAPFHVPAANTRLAAQPQRAAEADDEHSEPVIESRLETVLDADHETNWPARPFRQPIDRSPNAARAPQTASLDFRTARIAALRTEPKEVRHSPSQRRRYAARLESMGQSLGPRGTRLCESTSPDRSRELVSGSGLCFLCFSCDFGWRVCWLGCVGGACWGCASCWGCFVARVWVWGRAG